ncbi:MAG: hypothetical protein ACO3EZ_19290 [Prochlorotrichaceae cyanobacterium]
MEHPILDWVGGVDVAACCLGGRLKGTATQGTAGGGGTLGCQVEQGRGTGRADHGGVGDDRFGQGGRGDEADGDGLDHGEHGSQVGDAGEVPPA